MLVLGTAPVITPCASTDPAQHWITVGTELKSMEAGGDKSEGNCVTGAWPFVTSGAFKTPEGNVVVVAMNEADVAVEVRVCIMLKSR